MSEVKHTPGPWVAIMSSLGQPYQIRTFGGPDITRWGVFSRPASDEAKANAYLIAAAPDMLAALRDMVERYTALVNCGDCGSWNPEEDKEVIAARAAIAKAEGKQL